jgi:hypothetical protein
MQCHRCEHREAVEAGKYASRAFGRTPCAKCELQEDSSRTMAVEMDRPVFVPGHNEEVEPTYQMVLFHEELEPEEEMKLPVGVMGELVARLLSLPQELRDVVCWRFMGWSYPRIARKQGITMAGAEARHDRAMRLFPELRKLFARKMAKQKMRHTAGATA